MPSEAWRPLANWPLIARYLRCYRCDTAYRSHSPKMVRYPLLALSFTQAHLCNTPLATYLSIIVQYPIKTNTKKFYNTIARSMRVMISIRRDYHQSFVQPDFRAEKKRVLSGGFLLIFLCLRPKRTLKKSARNPGHQ